MERDEGLHVYEVSSFEICLKNVFLFLSFMYVPSYTTGSYMFSHRERLCCVLFNVGFLDFYASCSLCSSIIRFSRISNTIEHKHIFRSVLPRTDIFFFCVILKNIKRIFCEVEKKVIALTEKFTYQRSQRSRTSNRCAKQQLTYRENLH